MNTRTKAKKNPSQPNLEKVIEELEDDLLRAEDALEIEKNKHAQTQDYMDRLEEELSKNEEINRALILILFLMTGSK
jgi:site-specific DNA-adenine methylase